MNFDALFKTNSYTEQNLYFSHQSKNKLKELLSNVSESDARKILDLLLREVTKESKDLNLSEESTQAIILMNLDSCVESDVQRETTSYPVPPNPPPPPRPRKSAA